MPDLTWTFLSIGSNKEPERNVLAALDSLAQHLGPLWASSVYHSASVGFVGTPFLNLVVAVQTQLSMFELSALLKDIEDAHGRDRSAPKFSSRTLDIDLLLYGQAVGDFGGLILPRDEILYHAFVLWPLAELVPERLHPVCKRSYRDLWQQWPGGQAIQPVAFYWHDQPLPLLPPADTSLLA